jgi:hypothetical protein
MIEVTGLRMPRSVTLVNPRQNLSIYHNPENTRPFSSLNFRAMRPSARDGGAANFLPGTRAVMKAVAAKNVAGWNGARKGI